MYKKKLQLFMPLLLTCCSGFLYAQQPYYNQQENFLKANSVWAFGDSTGLDFNGGTPTAIKTAINVKEGTASVADPQTGQLLFYSDGHQCWNAQNQVMPNGGSLLGNAGSTTQGVCIVPVIDAPEKYYLFSLHGPTDGLDSLTGVGTLFYSIVDMSLNNGSGDIVSGRKNILLDKDTLSESMIAIPGDNCDIWLMVHTYRNPVFKAYHITAEGIDTVPVISKVGEQLQGVPPNFGGDPATVAYFSGGMAVSPDRSMIAIANQSYYPMPQITGLLLGKFDPRTGEVSDVLKLTDTGKYNVAFSPDNSKLYASSPGDWVKTPASLDQYDVTTYDSATIVSSHQVIASFTNTTFLSGSSSYGIRQYNGKLYMPLFIDDPNFNRRSLSCLDFPNLSGTASGYAPNIFIFSSSIPWPPNSSYYGNFPNDVVFPLPPDSIYRKVSDTVICDNQMILAADTTWAGYYWDDGTTGQKRTITTSGTYWVLNKDACHSRMDTFVVKIFNLVPPVISIDTFTLKTVASYTTYQWMMNGNIIPGATDSTYTVTQNGDYQVIVGNAAGCIDTSGIYTVNNVTGIRRMPELLSRQVTIYPNPAHDKVYIAAPMAVDLALCSIEGKILKSTKQAHQLSLADVAEGIYFLRIYDRQGRLIKTEKIIKAL